MEGAGRWMHGVKQQKWIIDFYSQSKISFYPRKAAIFNVSGVTYDDRWCKVV
jgi:hypothetical protein